MRCAFFILIAFITACAESPAQSKKQMSGNPILPGWYADPEGIVFENNFWIYPTYSSKYNNQVFLDAFSSADLINWKKHSHILDTSSVKWAKRAMWAPSVTEKNGRYYLFFGANDIQNNQERGGIGVAVADKPGGPFKDHIGKPLIDQFHNGAQPIDQFIFRDSTGKDYLIYGGWGHCNIVQLNNNYTATMPFNDGSMFKEITPQGYIEGPFMFIRNGKYYFMWSEGGWTGPDYSVAYAIADSPFGPFERIGKILQQDTAIATGAGHHSVMKVPGKDQWYIVYHRRPRGETDGNSRVTCIESLYFDEKGLIKPVIITKTGVEKFSLKTRRPNSKFKIQNSK